MLVQSLLNGSTKTCGAGSCRVVKAKVDKTYHPRGTSVLTLRQLQWAWATYHRVRNRWTMTQLAQHFDINRESLRSLFRAVRKCGGIEAYVQSTKG